MEKNENVSNIISDISPGEESSSFYLENKRICEEWESFILRLEGSIKGAFSSWSLKLSANLTLVEDWHIVISKSSLTNGTLLISPERNIIGETTLESTNIDLGKSKIKVQKSSLWNSIRKLIYPRIIHLNEHLIIFDEVKPNLRGVEMLKRIKELPLEYKLSAINYNPDQKSLKIKFDTIIMNHKLVESLIYE